MTLRNRASMFASRSSRPMSAGGSARAALTEPKPCAMALRAVGELLADGLRDRRRLDGGQRRWPDARQRVVRGLGGLRHDRATSAQRGRHRVELAGDGLVAARQGLLGGVGEERERVLDLVGGEAGVVL